MTKQPPKPDPQPPVRRPGESDAKWDKAMEEWLRSQGEWKKK